MKRASYLLILFLIAINVVAQPHWKNWNTSNSPIPTNDFTSMDIDANNNVWLSSDHGIAKFDGYNWVFFDHSNSPIPNDVCYAIATEGNTIWIGSVWGLVKFDGIANWILYTINNSGLPYNYITSIDIDTNGIKWIGTLNDDGTDGGGITKFDDTTWTNYNTLNSGIPTNWAFNAFTDHANIKWIGTSSGLTVYNDTIWSTYTSFNSGLPNNSIGKVIEDSILNSYWIGTNDGLAYFNKTLNSWTIYNTSNFLPDNGIGDIEIDSQNRKWFTTPLKGGVTMYDNTNWYYFNENNVGAFLRYASYLSFDSHCGLWVTTNNGLAYYGDTLFLSTGSEFSTEENKFYTDIFPMPANDFINVRFHNCTTDGKIFIYDLNGRSVYEKEIKNVLTTTTEKINISSLNSGIYFISASIDKHFCINKLIISH